MQTTKKSLKAIFAGLLTGGINGLFGGGGGMVAVPVFKNLLGYNQKRSHATAILVIAPVCALSAAVYIARGFFNPSLALPLSLGSLLGGAVGAKLLKIMPDNLINGVFALVMVAAGLRMLF